MNNFLNKLSLSNKKIATHNFNYAGILVTYTCWGYMVLFSLMTFLLFQIAACLFLGGSFFAAFILVILMPFLFTIFMFRLLNKCLNNCAARYCFLQTGGKKFLALKNTNTYHLYLYFRFFYDCFTGVAFCIMRVVSTSLLAILYLPRLDYSCVSGGLERMDTTFMAYVGHLRWEATHSHPIMICFCEILQRYLSLKVKMKKKMLKTNTARQNVLRNRWHLYYFMSKNELLLKHRRRK